MWGACLHNVTNASWVIAAVVDRSDASRRQSPHRWAQLVIDDPERIGLTGTEATQQLPIVQAAATRMPRRKDRGGTGHIIHLSRTV